MSGSEASALAAISMAGDWMKLSLGRSQASSPATSRRKSSSLAQASTRNASRASGSRSSSACLSLSICSQRSNSISVLPAQLCDFLWRRRHRGPILDWPAKVTSLPLYPCLKWRVQRMQPGAKKVSMTLPLFAANLTCVIEGRGSLALVKGMYESAESRRLEMTTRRIFLAITFAVMFIVSTAVTRAQSGSSQQSATQPASASLPRYALIEYFKIEPGKAAEYRKLEQEVWVPIHRERVKQRVIKSWW